MCKVGANCIIHTLLRAGYTHTMSVARIVLPPFRCFLMSFASVIQSVAFFKYKNNGNCIALFANMPNEYLTIAFHCWACKAGGTTMKHEGQERRPRARYVIYKSECVHKWIKMTNLSRVSLAVRKYQSQFMLRGRNVSWTALEKVKLNQN